MTPEQVEDLLTMLAGFWPHSAPDLGDPVAEAAWLAALHEVPATAVADAVLAISREAAEFCPPPGVVYARATAKKPPATAPYEALPVAAPKTDDEAFAANIAENRRRLEEIAKAKNDDSWEARRRDRGRSYRRGR